MTAVVTIVTGAWLGLVPIHAVGAQRATRSAASRDTSVARTDSASRPPELARRRPWYESFQIRGYTQVRYNRLLETNELLRCEQCDRSWGQNGGISIRRARVIIQGQVHPRVWIYLQPDFASQAGTTQLVAQI
ncbi:MAG: hypothetical protein MUD17_12990, partial [Gemmatimonadaceae bacterium]|nr:hypothetical protein [Gemmatimonadaceae bacterium]